MFDNACKYNEPDSQIYKDALTLQSLTLKTVKFLSHDTPSSPLPSPPQQSKSSFTIPDVFLATQEIIANIFDLTVSHQDENGRYYSDSLDEIKTDLNLKTMKRRIDKNYYKRLDSMQNDLFKIFDQCRDHCTYAHSQHFLDAVSLQKYYILTRNEICKFGNAFHSKALLFGLDNLDKILLEEKKKKKYSINDDEEEIISEFDGGSDTEFEIINFNRSFLF